MIFKQFDTLKLHQMNLREVQDQVARRLAHMPSVRRVYTRLGVPPRIRVDLVATATNNDDEAVRRALATLDCDLPIEIVHSGTEQLSPDNASKAN
jgi:hypothetical protein